MAMRATTLFMVCPPSVSTPAAFAARDGVHAPLGLPLGVVGVGHTTLPPAPGDA